MKVSYIPCILVLLTTQTFSQEIPFVEETPGNYQGAEYSIEGLVVGTPIQVDAAFAQQYGSPAPDSPFKVIVPEGENRAMAAGGGGTEFLSIGYRNESGATLELLRFTSLTVPLGDSQERLATLASLLINQGPALALNGWAEGSLESIYYTEVGGKDAVTVHGWCSDPAKGAYFVRLTGILHPNSTAGVLAFVLIDPALTGIGPESLSSAGKTLEVIHSLDFLNP